MDKTALTLIVFLLPLLGSSIQAQDTKQPSSSVPTNDDRETSLRLPDSPSHQQNFVLPPNREAGVIPKPRTEMRTDHEYTLTELIDIAERENPETRVAWQRARNAAISAGVAESTYLPVVTANVLGAYQGAQGSNSGSGVTLHNSGKLYGSAETV